MSKSRGLLRGFKTLQAHSSASTPLMEAAISRLNALPSAAHDSGGSYCFSHCADVAIRYKGLSVHAIGRNSSLSNTSLSSITHIRFLHVPTNQGRKNSKRSWVEPIEQTEVLVERNSESQGSSDHATKTVVGDKSRMRVGLGDKTNMLVDILLKLKDSKEAVYGALDSWVAWEQDFPLVVLKRALHILEKKQQWHRIIQVIKWILSKGQATTMGTYEQLLRALDKDRRAEEAHAFWEKRIGSNLHSVPWQLCTFMIYMYQRNNMPERLIKLFNDLEMYNRKPPDKVVVKKVADAYELLGLQDEQEKVLERYQSLFRSSLKSRSKKVREMLEDGDDKNTGEDKQEVAGNSPRDSSKPLESIPTNGDASCDSNGPASATLLSPSTAVEGV